MATMDPIKWAGIRTNILVGFVFPKFNFQDASRENRGDILPSKDSANLTVNMGELFLKMGMKLLINCGRKLESTTEIFEDFRIPV